MTELRWIVGCQDLAGRPRTAHLSSWPGVIYLRVPAGEQAHLTHLQSAALAEHLEAAIADAVLEGGEIG